MAEFYTLLTAIGEAKLANAIALGQTVEITHLAVGDGGGTLPDPQGDEVQLVNEVRRAPINTSNVDPDNPSWIVVEQIIPPDVGGWTIREIGIYDTAGDLIAYGNYPPTFKPTLDQGSSRTQTVRFVLEVSNAAVVELKVDPSVVLATREYVDQQRQEHEEDTEAHPASAIILNEPVAQAPDAESVQEALAALGAFATAGFQNIVVFDSPGVIDWAVPEVLQSGLRRAHVTVIAAGAGGGLSASAGSSPRGGGGAGGAALGVVDLTGISVVTVTVGQGGARGVDPDSDGSPGGSSSFGSHMSASGGNIANTLGFGGEGGVGVGGDIQSSGGGGYPATPVPGQTGTYWGGGGGSSLICAGSRGGSSSAIPARLGAGGGSGFNGSSPGGDGVVIVRW